MSFHAAPALVVNEADRATLNAVVRAPTSEQRAVTRARIVLASADGTAIARIAHELGVTVNTVKLWRRRYERMGLGSGRSGAARTAGVYGRAERDRVIALTLNHRQRHKHWSARRLGERVGMSETTVWRIWQTAKLKPIGSRRSSSARIRRSKPRSAMSSALYGSTGAGHRAVGR